MAMASVCSVHKLDGYSKAMKEGMKLREGLFLDLIEIAPSLKCLLH